MQKYKTLIFDLDNTLIDNNRSMIYAFEQLLNFLQLPCTSAMKQDWLDFDSYYWHQWESGKIILPDSVQTLEDKRVYLRTNYFRDFFRKYKIFISFETALKICDLYYSSLGVDIVEIEGASTLLQSLHNNYEIVIATNGQTETAYKKLEKSNLLPYIENVVSSDQIGFSKPMPEFFQVLFERVKNKEKDKMLLIGDSLNTDILGGNRNGIDTCWFNPSSQAIQNNVQPTMTIQKLLQLKKEL